LAARRYGGELAAAAVMTHAALMSAIRAEAATLGLMTFHGIPAGETAIERAWSAGFPDLVIVGPGGLMFVEVKSERGRLAEEQWSWAGLLLLSGAVHVTWRPADWPENVKEQLGRLAKV
jgi:hypothetical protein